MLSCKVVRFVLGQNTLTLQLKLLSYRRIFINFYGILNEWVKYWKLNFIYHLIVHLKNFLSVLTGSFALLCVVWNLWNVHVVKIVFKLVFILSYLHGFALNFRKSERLFRFTTLIHNNWALIFYNWLSLWSYVL